MLVPLEVPPKFSGTPKASLVAAEISDAVGFLAEIHGKSPKFVFFCRNLN